MKELTRVLPSASTHWVGDGFPVRTLVSIDRDAVQASPFLMLDYAGPHRFAPGDTPRGVGAHPHRGFETVTIVYQGEVAHRDTAGNSGVIGPGDVQWMTAGAGVLHEEFHSRAFTEAGGVLEMAQLWVNLPARDKLCAPAYQAIVSAQIPRIALGDGAGDVRVIAGHYAGAQGPALTRTPMNVWDVKLNAERSVAFDFSDGWTAVLVVLRGQVVAGGMRIDAPQAAQFSGPGTTITAHAEVDSQLLLLSGAPLDEPIAHYGPFVMNTRQELLEAVEAFKRGDFQANSGASVPI
ncbi:MAG: pirin family protein [Pseudomonadota bacterium]